MSSWDVAVFAKHEVLAWLFKHIVEMLKKQKDRYKDDEPWRIFGKRRKIEIPPKFEQMER